jgi:hypothetical protein
MLALKSQISILGIPNVRPPSLCASVVNFLRAASQVLSFRSEWVFIRVHLWLLDGVCRKQAVYKRGAKAGKSWRTGCIGVSRKTPVSAPDPDQTRMKSAPNASLPAPLPRPSAPSRAPPVNQTN